MDVRILPARIQAPQLLRVAAYARVSTRNEHSFSSLSAQVSYYNKLIGSTPGWAFAGVYVDNGITGTSTTYRGDFNRMMNDAATGKINLILTKSISRFARNTIDLLKSIRELKTLGIPVRFERENIDTATADGELLLTLLASFAQEESRSISQNVKWAIRRKYREGISNSRRLYGYTWTGDRLIINKDEAAILQRIFTEYLQGISPETIAERLNQEGLRAHKGALFRGSLIRTWLENPRYVGDEMLQASYVATPGSHAQPNDEVLPKYWVQQANPAIIDRQTWQQVQDEIARRRASGGLALTPSVGTSALTHRVLCSQCGRRFHRRTRKRARSTYKFWWCETATRGTGNPCHAPQIREEALKEAVLTTLGVSEWEDEHILTLIDHITIYPTREVTLTPIDSKQEVCIMAG